jgi:hypothetical protein
MMMNGSRTLHFPKRWLTKAIIATVLASCVVHAQTFNNVGSTGAQFLKIGVGARAMGMGGAYGSITGDVTSLAWNPAGIGTIDGLQFSAQHTIWVAGIAHDFIGVSVPINEQFSLGFHTVYLTSGDIEITTIDVPEGTGRFYDVSDLAAGLTGSVRLTQQLTFALTLKYVEERIYDMSSDGLALDAGMTYATDLRSLNLGFSISHLGFDQALTGRSLDVRYTSPNPAEPSVKSEMQTMSTPMPLMFRAGGSFDVMQLLFNHPDVDPLLVAFDFVQQSDTPERVHLGMEYAWNRLLFARAGYIFNADELSWNAGGGMKIEIAKLVCSADYAASWLGRFGLGQRFGLTVTY